MYPDEDGVTSSAAGPAIESDDAGLVCKDVESGSEARSECPADPFDKFALCDVALCVAGGLVTCAAGPSFPLGFEAASRAPSSEVPCTCDDSRGPET